jgi:hypothetical protein
VVTRRTDFNRPTGDNRLRVATSRKNKLVIGLFFALILLFENLELDAPVFIATLGALIIGDRPGLSVTFGNQTRDVDTVFNQVARNGSSAPFGKV